MVAKLRPRFRGMRSLKRGLNLMHFHLTFNWVEENSVLFRYLILEIQHGLRIPKSVEYLSRR